MTWNCDPDEIAAQGAAKGAYCEGDLEVNQPCKSRGLPVACFFLILASHH